MSKKMTPCEKLGYKVGDKFKVVDGTGVHYAVGSFITLIHDDGSSCPRFNGVHAIFESGDSFFPLDFVERVAKLKPAKQALADAIHQNGGWRHGAKSAAQCKSDMTISFYRDVPDRDGDCWWGDYISGVEVKVSKLTNNWHQCVISRDEYFTAYPDQVKVDVNNETEQNVEPEMTSESEMTINVGDWYKNRELPPVGEVCMWVGRKDAGDYRDDLRTGDQVEIIAHYKPRHDGPVVAVFAYDSRESVGRQTDQSIAKCFSPLRTERDKAIDEMAKAIIAKSPIRISPEDAMHLAGEMHDYGYRKEVK